MLVALMLASWLTYFDGRALARNSVLINDNDIIVVAKAHLLIGQLLPLIGDLVIIVIIVIYVIIVIIVPPSPTPACVPLGA